MAFVFILLVILIFLSVPVVFSIGSSSLLYFFAEGRISALNIIALRMFNGVNVYVFIAVPLFLLAGEIMMRSGITERILKFANLVVGHLRGLGGDTRLDADPEDPVPIPRGGLGHGDDAGRVHRPFAPGSFDAARGDHRGCERPGRTGDAGRG